MKLDTPKDLEKIIQVCRKTGVTHLKLEGLEIELGSLPTKQPKTRSYQLDTFPEADIRVPQFTPMPAVQVAEKIATDALTDEQLLFYSARAETPEEQAN